MIKADARARCGGRRPRRDAHARTRTHPGTFDVRVVFRFPRRLANRASPRSRAFRELQDAGGSALFARASKKSNTDRGETPGRRPAVEPRRTRARSRDVAWASDAKPLDVVAALNRTSTLDGHRSDATSAR